MMTMMKKRRWKKFKNKKANKKDGVRGLKYAIRSVR